MTGEQVKHVRELLQGFDTVMIVTHGLGGGMHGRPMGIAEISESGVVQLVTSVNSQKVKEIENNPEVGLIFQGRFNFVSLQAKASVVTDSQMIERLWSEAWKVWFPKGKTDPDIRLLSIIPASAEYWDASGLEGIEYAFEAAKAYLKGEKPHVGVEQHGKVQL